MTITDQSSEVARLTRALRKQGAEKKRLGVAYSKLKQERRAEHEFLAIIGQLEEEIERLEKELHALRETPYAVRFHHAQRSRFALSIRYGHLHKALRELVADSDTWRSAAEALRDVEDRDWIRERLAT